LYDTDDIDFWADDTGVVSSTHLNLFLSILNHIVFLVKQKMMKPFAVVGKESIGMKKNQETLEF
jgi:hypothetical protein